MIPSASDPDLLNIVDVLLSSFSGAAAGAASAAPWRVPLQVRTAGRSKWSRKKGEHRSTPPGEAGASAESLSDARVQEGSSRPRRASTRGRLRDRAAATGDRG